MALPSPKDLEKKAVILSTAKKKVDKMYLSDEAMEKAICSVIRSNVRQTWMMHPIRLLKVELARIPDLDPKTRTKWLFECEHCRQKFKEADIQVDHIKGEHSLVNIDELVSFARSILDVKLDDLQIMCKECHETKTYAERYDLSWEDAVIEKKVILWIKMNSVTIQKKLLLSYGFELSAVSNGDKRRDAYRAHLKRTT